MRDSNISTRKRIEALEARLAAQERALDSQAQRARMWQWPRDMWIGRTTASTPSSYPEDGDTFQVKLLSAHFTATEGTQAVTEYDRGTIVTARTIPAAYLPYGTDVIVKRVRGIGPNGSGEWWIEPSLGGYDRCVMSGVGGADFSYDNGQIAANDPTIPYYGGSPTDGIWSFPEMVGVIGNAGGNVFAVRNAGGLLGSPTTWTDTWIECNAFTWYRLHVHTTWSLAKLTETESEASLAVARHSHPFYDFPGPIANNTDLEPLLSVGLRPRATGQQNIWVVTEAVPSFGARHELGRSTLSHWWNAPDSEPMYASHSGVCQVAGFYRPGPLTWRLRVYAYAPWYAYSATPQLTRLTVSVEQCSDPIADPSA